MSFEGRFRLVDLSSKTEIGSQDTDFDFLVISVDQFSDGLGLDSVEGAEGEVESVLLFDNPSQSALLDEDSVGKLTEEGRIELME